MDASRVRRFVLTWCLMICLYVYSSLMQCLYLINDEYTMLVFFNDSIHSTAVGVASHNNAQNRDHASEKD